MTNHFVYLKNDPMIKSLFFKHRNEKAWGVQSFTLTPYVNGLRGLGS
jgi:hypothetical protein